MAWPLLEGSRSWLPVNKENQRYLETKQAKMGHIYGTELKSHFNYLIDSISNGKASIKKCPEIAELAS